MSNEKKKPKQPGFSDDIESPCGDPKCGENENDEQVKQMLGDLGLAIGSEGAKTALAFMRGPCELLPPGVSGVAIGNAASVILASGLKATENAFGTGKMNKQAVLFLQSIQTYYKHLGLEFNFVLKDKAV